MSKVNVFGVDRGVFSHPVFKREPATEVQAWIWLLSEAAWRPRLVRIGDEGPVINLGRGQVAHSLRYLARAWGWSEPRVRRFLKRLKTNAMIDAATDAGVTVVSITNYDKFQVVWAPTDAPADALSDAQATQNRRQENSTLLRKGAERAANVIPIDPDIPADLKAVLFAESKAWLCELGKTKDNAGRIVGRWLKEAHDDAGLVLSIVREARSRNLADPVAWVMGAIKERDDRRQRERDRFLWRRQ